MMTYIINFLDRQSFLLPDFDIRIISPFFGSYTVLPVIAASRCVNFAAEETASDDKFRHVSLESRICQF